MATVINSPDNLTIITGGYCQYGVLKKDNTNKQCSYLAPSYLTSIWQKSDVEISDIVEKSQVYMFTDALLTNDTLFDNYDIAFKNLINRISNLKVAYLTDAGLTEVNINSQTLMNIYLNGSSSEQNNFVSFYGLTSDESIGLSLTTRPSFDSDILDGHHINVEVSGESEPAFKKLVNLEICFKKGSTNQDYIYQQVGVEETLTPVSDYVQNPANNIPFVVNGETVTSNRLSLQNSG